MYVCITYTCTHLFECLVNALYLVAWIKVRLELWLGLYLVDAWLLISLVIVILTKFVM